MNFALSHGYDLARRPRVMDVAGGPRVYAKGTELPVSIKKAPHIACGALTRSNLMQLVLEP